MADEPWANDPLATDPQAQPWANDPIVQPKKAAMTPEEQSRTGQLGYEPSSVTAGTEPTKASEALRANIQPMVEHPIDTAVGMVTNWDDLKHLYQQPQDILGPTAKRVLEMPVRPDEEIGSQEFYNTGVNAAMIAAGMRPELRERATRPASAPEAPEAAKTAPESPAKAAGQQANAATPWANDPTLESITARVQSKPELSESQAEVVNQENAPAGEEPAPEAESATAEAAPVAREAVSLDELRLMREKSELQLQKDLNSRAGMPGHPAIDERITQIDDQLDQIANDAMGQPFDQVPEGANEEIRQNEADRLAREQEDTTFRPENEPRPSDEAVTRGEQGVSVNEAVGQLAGRGTSVSQQPAGVGARTQPQASGARGTASPRVGVAEEYAKAELGNSAVIPGEGKTWQEARDFGSKYINEGGDPEAPIRVAQKTGRSGWKEVGIVSAEYERRAADRRKAASELAKSPHDPKLMQNYVNAEKAQVAWRKQLQPVLTKASDALRAAQGERRVNTADYNDLVDLAIHSMGKNVKDLTPRERTALAKGARDKAKADSASVNASEKIRQEVRRQAGGKTMSLDELKGAAEDFAKKAMADCVV